MATRGFPKAEFQARVKRAQAMMAKQGLAALLLTTEAEIRYFSGFLTRFWESPTRVWFLIVPASGDPIAVIPAIGAHLMRQSWIADIRTWAAPNYEDDGISLLAVTLREVCGVAGQIGVPDQMESHVQMPLSGFRALEAVLAPLRIVGDGAIVRTLRMVKSDGEIAKIERACGVADRAFARVGEVAHVGAPLSDVFRGFQGLCLGEGADFVPYVAGASGQGGYGDVISPADDTPLALGDVLMLDTGLIWDGYYCDFDRNFSLGQPNAAIKAAHGRLIDAVQAGADKARAGATMADLFHAMNDVVHAGPDAGRLGHGLGMRLTEWPSIIAEDHTVLEAGMVLALEPNIETGDGLIMVHEENIVITDGAARFISDFQPDRMRVI
ncbi:Xaa-Pro peptidase family protein [bacterium]|nr:Xaa-Pro peptidase family protein [bacterium]